MILNYLKRGFWNITLLGTSQVFSRVIHVIFLPYFVSHLSLQEFGIWDFHQMLTVMGTSMFTSSMATPLLRFYFYYQKNKSQQNKVIGTTLW